MSEQFNFRNPANPKDNIRIVLKNGSTVYWGELVSEDTKFITIRSPAMEHGGYDYGRTWGGETSLSKDNISRIERYKPR